MYICMWGVYVGGGCVGGHVNNKNRFLKICARIYCIYRLMHTGTPESHTGESRDLYVLYVCKE